MKDSINKKPKLTRKQAIFVKGIAEGKTGEQAAMEAYNIWGKHWTKDPKNTARAIASENLAKPNISSALDDLAYKAKTILDRVLDGEKINDKEVSPSYVIDVAKYVHDKVNGKATQKIEAETNNYNIEIDENTPEDVLLAIINRGKK